LYTTVFFIQPTQPWNSTLLNMTFKVFIFGCGAATPTLQHHPSAQVINLHDKLFMVDCGEGTQLQCRKYGFGFQRISAVFISHLHGDHYLGLVGLMSSMHLLGRKQKLKVFGPPALQQLIQINLELSSTQLSYEVEFFPTSDHDKQMIYEDHTLRVFSLPLKHRIFCTGFLFEEKQRPLKVIKSFVDEYQLMPSQILQLKKGNDITLDNGVVIRSSDACVIPPPPRSYAYCSDTAFFEDLIQHIPNVDLLYHESTFLESELLRAAQTFHSTAGQAAQIAKRSGAKRLLLGHFSSRYRDESKFLEEASAVFPCVELADEGLVVEIPTADLAHTVVSG
jgi:ribonuclease Z